MDDSAMFAVMDQMDRPIGGGGENQNEPGCCLGSFLIICICGLAFVALMVLLLALLFILF